MARSVLARLAPASLTGRVFALYAAVLAAVVATMVALFLRYEFAGKIESAESSAQALSRAMLPAVSDSAVIGDFDTIRRTLSNAAQSEDIVSASFLPTRGGRIDVRAPGARATDAPEWLQRTVEERLSEVNTVVTAGGVDYGVMRLTIDTEGIAGVIWDVAQATMWLFAAALLVSMIVTRWALRRWLAPLERLGRAASPAGAGVAMRADLSGAPTEVAQAVRAFERTESALQMERVTAAATLGAVGDAVVTTDLQGRIVYANTSAIRLFALTDGVGGRLVTDLLPMPAGAAQADGTIADWNRAAVVLTASPAAGREGEVHLETSLTPIVDVEGATVGHVLTCRDVSAAKAYEHRLTNELQSRQSAVRSLREALLGMLGEAELLKYPVSESDLESVALLVADLVRHRETSRRELDNRIFALDQHAAVTVADARGTIVYANPRMVELGGYSQEELIGANHRLLSSGLHDDGFFRDLWRTIASGRVWHGEIANRHKSGPVYWVATTIVPWLDEHGAPTRYIAIRTDITQRRTAQQRLELQYEVGAALAESDDLEHALGRVLKAICERLGWQLGLIWRREGECMRLQQSWHVPAVSVDGFVAASRALDYGSGEGLPGRVWRGGEPLWSEDISRDPEFCSSQAAQREGLHGAFAFPLSVRGEVWGVAEFLSARIESPDASLLTAAATLGVQIGQFILRRQTQDALERSEQFFRSVFEEGQVGMSVSTLDGRYQRVNRALCELLGHAESELLGRTSVDVTHPEDRAGALDAIESMRSGRAGTVAREKRYLRADGGVVWALVRTRVLTDAAGRPEQLLSQALDITSLKDAERSLRAEKHLLEEAKARELQTGHQIQRALLIGEIPAGLPGADIAGYAVPSRGIDGDFYAFTRFGPGRFEVLVGDVMGKGVPAALVGAGLRTSYHQVVTELVAATAADGLLPEPAAIVDALHRRLTPRLIELDTFVTLALYRFDLDQGRLNFVNAGHTAGLLRRRGGAVERLLGSNVPLGVLADERYVDESTPVLPGDALFVYSDGISEARDASGEFLGEEAIERLLAGLDVGDLPSHTALQVLRKRLYERVDTDGACDDETGVLVSLRDVPEGAAVVDFDRGAAQIELPWDLAHLGRLRAHVAAAASTLPAEAADRLVLAAFEAASNILRHVAPAFTGATLLCRTRRAHAVVTVELWYVGPGFEPAARSAPDLSGASEGGFGLYIIEQSVSRVRYEQPVPGVCCTRLEQRA